jgi:hypothetical protein
MSFVEIDSNGLVECVSFCADKLRTGSLIAAIGARLCEAVQVSCWGESEKI